MFYNLFNSSDFNELVDVDILAEDYEQFRFDPIDHTENRVETRETRNENVVDAEPEPQIQGDVVLNNNLRRSSRQPKPKVCSCCNLSLAKCELKDFDDNVNVCDALSGPDRDKWLSAMNSEFQNLASKHVWDIVKKPRGKHIIDCRWILRVKRNVDGSINKYKARLVARGFSQVPGLHYSETGTYCPVVKRRTWRLLLALCVENDWICEFIDVQGAYLNSELKEELYMYQPSFFVERGNDYVCKLNKSLYGLKQGGKDWHSHINQIMCNLNFVRCHSDNCVYIHPSFELVISWYVDDACICGVPERVAWFKECLANTLEIRCLGSNSQYLSIQTCQNADKSISLSQSHYVSQVLKYYMMYDAKGLDFPLEIKPESNVINNSKPFDVTMYQEAVGTLLYLSNNTRPDLSYAVSKLSQRTQCPTFGDWKNVKHVLRYLVSTKDYKLTYTKSGEVIKVFCDSDFAGDIVDRMSRSGYVILLANCPISWYSKKQTCVALSTVEAEYISMCNVTREVVWLKQLLSELGMLRFMDTPCIVKCDNQGAIGLSNKVDENVSERSKHIDVQYKYCVDMQLRGVVKYQYIPSSENVADVFTKAFLGPDMHKFCKLMGINKS